MKTGKNVLKIGVIVLFTLFTISSAYSQATKYSAKNNLGITVSGGSSLHDWDMKGTQGEVVATITLNAANQITAVSDLSFVTPSKGIKSEHGSMMDNKAYDALKADKNANITFTAASATVTGNTIKAIGKLTIAGVTRDAEVDATYKVNADKSISINGSKAISLKDFSITPPSVMFMKVKNDLKISFTLTLKK